jgi:RNA polymerase sigma factor (sigma-70 family)
MLDDLDRALQRENPVSSLRGIARRSIKLSCAYRSSLIGKPWGLTRQQWERRGEVIVESLHAPLTIDGTLIHLDAVGAPASWEEEDLEERCMRYAALYKALKTLSPRERLVLMLRFGLDGQPGMRRETIGELIGRTSSGINWTESRALEQLRRVLGTREAALVCPDSEEAERLS